MTERRWFTIETDGLPRAERTTLCRAVLESLAVDAVRFQTDIPVAAGVQWEPHAAMAAEALRQRAKHPDGEYTSVGWLDADPESWEAFELVAPYAYDAGVLDRDGHYFIRLHDEGGMALHLSPEQLLRVQSVLPADRLVPIESRPGWLSRRLARLNRGVRDDAAPSN